MSDEHLSVTTGKAEAIETKLKEFSAMCSEIDDKFEGYDAETAALDEKLLAITKKATDVSDNSHLDHLQSQLKDVPTKKEDSLPSASTS